MKLKMIAGIILTLLFIGMLNAVVPVSAGAYTGPEDVNGDGVVDMRDIGIAAAAFGSYPGHPRWNPDADINQDNVVDMRDLATIARNFGKTA